MLKIKHKSRKEYLPHLKNYVFPKPSHNIFIPNNDFDKSYLACLYRINHKISLPLYLYYENFIDSKEQIYKDIKHQAGVYVFINKINKKYYIGSSVSLLDRMSHYIHTFNNKNYSNRIIEKLFKNMEHKTLI